jgi:iron complex transport system ATP-binding protein
MLRAENISFNIGGKQLLHETSLQFQPGLFHVIIGANGAGKSTLLKLLAGDQKPTTGKIFLGGKELNTYSKKQLATKRAVLSQQYNLSFPITVKDIVLMGRYPYFINKPTTTDIGICEEAMRSLNLYDLRERDYNTLSGGEAQKVQMSRVLAQISGAHEGEDKVLFLDEPVAHLDVKYQQQLLVSAKNLCSHHTTVIAILHDINLTLSFADSVLMMKNGKVIHCLTEVRQLSATMIDEVFDVTAKITYPDGDQPIVYF